MLGPISVSSHEELEEFSQFLTLSLVTRYAVVSRIFAMDPTKLSFLNLRLYLFTIPHAKIPPIVLAALVRGGSARATDFKALRDHVIARLHDANIHPVSPASDGSEVERTTQRLIAPDLLRYRIVHEDP